MTIRKWMWLAAALLVGTLSAQRAVAQSGTTNRYGRNITCASDDGRRHYCRIDTRNQVQLTNQRSGSACILGQTWGYDRGGIWVDRGCRADFVVGGGGGFYPPPPPPGGGYYPPPQSPPYGGQLTCSSNDGGRKFCSAYTGNGVRLVNQRSGSPCIMGQTWGYNNRGVWVDRGCRADFALGR